MTSDHQGPLQRSDVVAALQDAGRAARMADLPEDATRRVRHLARACLAQHDAMPRAGWHMTLRVRPFMLGGLAVGAILATVLRLQPVSDPPPQVVHAIVTESAIVGAGANVQREMRQFRQRYGLDPEFNRASPADALRAEIAAVSSRIRE